jgi:hypothetical protein
MLYFTESDDAIEDPAALNEQFTAQYDTPEYEKKISRMVAHAYRRIKRDSPEKLRAWNDALRILRKGDHYILVFCKEPNPSKPLGRWTFQIFGAFAVLGLYLLLFFFFGSRGNLRRGEAAPLERFFSDAEPTYSTRSSIPFLAPTFSCVFSQDLFKIREPALATT